MTTPTDTPIDALAAPPDDGAILVWPEPPAVFEHVAKNRNARRCWRFELLGRPIQTWLKDRLADRPVIMAGHQPEFFHPGVWAKTVAINGLAERTEGRAAFVLVDSDVPDSLAVVWPVRRERRWRTNSVAPFPGTAPRSYESHTDWPAADRNQFASTLPTVVGDSIETALEPFRDALRRTASGPVAQADYVSAWMEAMRALDRSLGVQPPEYVRIGRRFSLDQDGADPAAAALVGHLLIHADAFAGAYNQALTGYRRRRGIRGDRHPVPDLLIESDRCELPFWVVDHAAARGRLSLSPPRNGEIELFSDDQRIGAVGVKTLTDEPASALREALGCFNLRPRALALTLYARLLACDLFVHGIGGAKYDQMTDEIIRRFFGIEPPAFACVSATLRLPLATQPESPAQYGALLRRGRDLRYNPQRFLSDEARRDARIAERIDLRRRSIAESDRLRRSRSRDRKARRAAFDRIHQANVELQQFLKSQIEALARQREAAARAMAERPLTHSREWFVGLHPARTLRSLAERVDAAFSEAAAPCFTSAPRTADSPCP